MESTTLLPPELPLELHRDVQRKLGRCLLRLQQYEMLLKVVVAHSDIAGAPEEWQSVRDAQVAKVQNVTLGALVNLLSERFLTSSVDDDSTDEPQGEGGFWFRYRFRVQLNSSQLEETLAALKELVTLRNDLVHHFLERYNIWELHSCRQADTYLDSSYETIDGHYMTLRGWVQQMNEATARHAALMQTPEFQNCLLGGINPDSSVCWPISGVVCCLREAETQFATEGWTLLNTATAWIRKQYPEQTPERYGCGSWRQVIHESRLFEIRKTINQEQGRGEVWYRSRQDKTN